MSKPPAPLRKRLNHDYLIKNLRSDFEKIPDHRAPNSPFTYRSTIRLSKRGRGLMENKIPSELLYVDNHQ
ncbi:MAG: hypothetical protein P8Q41_06165 [Saprospiraceae bacterium]|nr:hypothetical protein [Saprospiraceae bacterium]